MRSYHIICGGINFSGCIHPLSVLLQFCGIDFNVDEVGFELADLNRSIGHAPVGVCVGLDSSDRARQSRTSSGHTGFTQASMKMVEGPVCIDKKVV